MLDKNEARLRRARQTRLKIREIGATRLTVYRTNSHIYAQIIAAGSEKVLATASTAEKEVRAQSPKGGDKAAAALVGKRIAEKAKAAGVTEVAFDRSGFSYHGRVKALAVTVRSAATSPPERGPGPWRRIR